MIQIGDPLLARTIETLRYQSYTLEKDIMCLGQPAQRFSGVRLYVLLSGDEREKTLTLADQCARGGADCLQLRAKTLSDQTLFALAQEFVQLCRSQEVLSIINDRADIAIAAGADGVHLGLEDLPIEEVRKLALQPLIVGLTTHNRAELSAAVEKDPSYVAVGPAFPSPTKPTLRPAGLDYVKEALELLTLGGLNHAVIGGITADNLGQICSLGATTLAIGTHISASSSPAEACRRVKEALLATIS